ncbi:hypothetical protein I0C86_13745 [Plantactinospora sp. S1510]|uniref:Histidine kinase/HSP90-like ATPase domain-containing protein n=1 Tax=Plantactinospora alkalitolerans TaxID=2789879 RepID=A0ABS0GVI7_9ACTN|nr:hypothetical protein [Plantactinospora alkalitolerans]MBF9130013.1 hypothetical protein [Plantactinospora alkalitolerans]
MEAVLYHVITRTVVAFRLMWAAAAAAMAVTFAALGEGAPLALLGAACSIAWTVVIAATCRRRFPRCYAVIDIGVFVALLLSARWMLPLPLVGDGATWVFTGATVAALIAAWTLPWEAALGLGAALIGAYLGGLAIAGRDVWSRDYLLTAFLLTLQAVLGVVVLITIRQAAWRADRALAERVATEAAHALDLAREAERHRQENVLHDEVRRALWMLGHGFVGAAEEARRLCREALRHLDSLAQGRLAPQRVGPLVNRIERAVDEFIALGMSVHPWWTRVDDQRRRRASRGQAPAGRIPVAVLDAIVEVLREALANVCRHANTNSADVEVRIGSSQITIVITDTGTGIELSNALRGRAVPTSIEQRMTPVGGYARVERLSAGGTKVTAGWTGAQSMPAVADVTEAPLRAYGGGFVRMIAIIAAVFHGMALYHLMQLSYDYRRPWLTLVCWLIMLVAGAALGGGVGRQWMTSARARFAAFVVAVSAVVVVANCHPWGMLGMANWAVGVAGWILALLAAHRPIREAVAALVLVGVGNIMIILPHVYADPVRLVKLMGVLLGVALVQVGAVIAFAFVKRTAHGTATDVWHSSQLVVAQTRDDEAQATRSLRHAQVDRGIIDLIRGIAEERLDPHLPEVRRRCLAASDALRHRDLAPLADTAAKCNVDLNLSAVTALTRVPQRSRERMVGVLNDALRFARPGRAFVACHDGADLLAPSGTPESEPGDAPITVTLAVAVQPGRGGDLADELTAGAANDASSEVPPVMEQSVVVEVALSDDDDNEAGPAAATTAWIAVVYRP